MRKRRIVLTACILLGASLMLVSCGKKEDQKNPASAGAEKISAETEAASDTKEDASSEEEKVYTAAEILAPLGFEVTEYVTLSKDYTSMVVERSAEKEVTEADIQEMLEAFVYMYPNTYVDSDKKTVEKGDVANIDYTGYLDGETFSGGSGTDYNLEIGSGSFIPGFEDGLIGAETGSTVDVPATFPEDYGVDDLNGKDVTFKVTVNGIKKKQKVTVDTISDQWVADNFSSEGCSTIEQLKEYIKDYIKNANESDSDSVIEDTIIGKLLEGGSVKIPDGYLEKRIELYKKSVYDTVEESGKSFEERMNMSEKDFLDSIEKNMETRLKKELLLEALVKDLDITFTQQEYNDYLYTYMTNYGYQKEEDMYKDLSRLSELDGEDYLKLGYAEHQAWYKLRQMVLKDEGGK